MVTALVHRSCVEEVEWDLKVTGFLILCLFCLCRSRSWPLQASDAFTAQRTSMDPWRVWAVKIYVCKIIKIYFTIYFFFFAFLHNLMHINLVPNKIVLYFADVQMILYSLWIILIFLSLLQIQLDPSSELPNKYSILFLGWRKLDFTIMYIIDKYIIC